MLLLLFVYIAVVVVFYVAILNEYDFRNLVEN